MIFILCQCIGKTCLQLLIINYKNIDNNPIKVYIYKLSYLIKNMIVSVAEIKFKQIPEQYV